jgi:hypothetical protein
MSIAPVVSRGALPVRAPECIQERIRNARYLKSDSSNKLL